MKDYQIYCVHFGVGDNWSLIEIPSNIDYFDELELYKRSSKVPLSINSFIDFLNARHNSQSSRVDYKTVSF